MYDEDDVGVAMVAILTYIASPIRMCHILDEVDVGHDDDGWMNEWMNEWMDRWMNEPMSRTKFKEGTHSPVFDWRSDIIYVCMYWIPYHWNGSGAQRCGAITMFHNKYTHSLSVACVKGTIEKKNVYTKR